MKMMKGKNKIMASFIQIKVCNRKLNACIKLKALPFAFHYLIWVLVFQLWNVELVFKQWQSTVNLLEW